MNRLGQTKWLNVLQGSDWDTAEKWYDGVKEFSDPKGKYAGREAEGWAMGGANMCKMDITLKRLMTLREDGLLEGKNWMHFLGTAQLDWSCYLTLIQRQIRKHINPEITISFDCASPFIATAHGLVYTNAVHTNKRWSVIMDKAPDNKALAKSDIPFPFASEVASRLNMGDICWYAPGMLNKINKEGKTSWDSFAYALMMGHNVECHIVAVQRAQQLMDIETAKHKPDWRMKGVEGKKEKEYSDWVPNRIIYFATFVEELFNTTTKEQAFDLIESATPFLRSLEGARLQGGPKSHANPELFDWGGSKTSTEEEFDQQDDDDLRALEEGAIDEA
jgi:hypothetical protein